MNILQLLAQAHSALPHGVAPPPQAAPAPQPLYDPNTASASSYMPPPPPVPISVQQAPQELPTAHPDLPPQPSLSPAPQAPQDPVTPVAPTHRRSVLDTIGRISDVLAKVGGADALYQPTLDANTARMNAVDLEKQRHTLGEQQLTTGQEAIEDHGSARMGAAMRGLTAIQAGGGDVTKAWPIIAANLHISPEETTHIAGLLASDPKNTIDMLTSALNAPDKTGSSDGDVQKYNMLMKADPTGELGKQFLAGVAGGKTKDITPYQQAQLEIQQGKFGLQKDGFTYRQSNDKANRDERQYEFRNPRPKAGAAGGGNTNAINALGGLHDSLGDLLRDPNLEGATGIIAGRLSVTAGQREIDGRLASLEGQAIPAAIAAIKSSGGASPRAVSEIMGEVKGLIGAIHNRQMDYKDYVANISGAQHRLSQRINDLHAADAATPAAAPARSSGGLPPRLGTHPTARAPAASGWGKAQVIR